MGGKEFAKPSKLRDEKHVRAILKRLENYMHFMDNHEEYRAARIIENGLIQAVEHNNFDYISAIEKAKMTPVTIDEFLEDDIYLGQLVEVWPVLREDLRRMKPDLMLGEKPTLEILNRSCIGTGKSVLGQISLLYDIYFLCCFDHPQELFGNLMRYTPIVFVLQSVRPQITNRVLYHPLRQIFEDIPFNRKYVKWDKDKESSLILENNVQLVPMVADPSHFLGQAVIGGHIDEANFMEVVMESKKAPGPQGKGGLYDQAELVYKNITGRRMSRFLTKGPNPGCIYVSSSVNYKGDFLDRRIAAVQDTDTHIQILDYRQWDVKPFGFSDDKFKFLVGTDDYPAKVLSAEAKPGVDYHQSGQVEEVPMDFYNLFRDDPETAQRDFLGIASSAISRYISQVHKIVESVVAGTEYGLEPFVENQNIVLGEDGGLFVIDESKLPADRDVPRFIHIDLSRSADRCAIAMTKILGYQAMNVEGVVEQLPVYAVEMAVSIEPSAIHQIDIANVRRWAMLLNTFYGFNIQCVSYDGFDSQESIQIWRKSGVQSMVISMDKTTEPYDLYKTALYQNRVLMVNNPLARQELAQLERHEQGGKSKIDHPPKGSKDIADAIVGSIKNASMARRVRANSMIVDSKGNPIVNTQRRSGKTQRRNPGGRPSRTKR